ncbi:cAMP receptor protein [Maioricimonas rarisocia]|uniref:cAMP receptor protein n=1 Tax=Maioricimonas rarisocia TaxID=2528026 RepID=A0A517Z274_9PLAN|nr:cyclic nucleotide-binding domain-containing protein [Maioricimonas rarisocia]QDU36575.1 cAMP receptor protein [Maioricimonas rarisocia]
MLQNNNNPSQVAQCAVLQDMNEAELEAFFGHVEFRCFEAGETILEEGKSSQYLWIIATGKCQIIKNCGDGVSNTLAVLEPGGVFGEMSFFEEAPHSASVNALTDTETMLLSRAGYDELIESHPSVAYKIASRIVGLVASRLRQMDEWTCRLVDQQDSEERYAEWQDFRNKLYSEWSF